MIEDKEQVDHLLDSGNLTKWEQSFIESLSEKLDHGCSLSEREKEKLDEIYDTRA